MTENAKCLHLLSDHELYLEITDYQSRLHALLEELDLRRERDAERLKEPQDR